MLTFLLSVGYPLLTGLTAILRCCDYFDLTSHCCQVGSDDDEWWWYEIVAVLVWWWIIVTVIWRCIFIMLVCRQAVVFNLVFLPECCHWQLKWHLRVPTSPGIKYCRKCSSYSRLLSVVGLILPYRFNPFWFGADLITLKWFNKILYI